MSDVELSTERETGLVDQEENQEDQEELEGDSTENFTTPRPNQGSEPS